MGGRGAGRAKVSGERLASAVALPFVRSKRAGARSAAKLRMTVSHKGRQSPDSAAFLAKPSLPKAEDSALLRAPREDTLPRRREASRHRAKARGRTAQTLTRGPWGVRWRAQGADTRTPVAAACQCTAKPLQGCKETGLQLKEANFKKELFKNKIIKQATEPPNVGTHVGTRAT